MRKKMAAAALLAGAVAMAPTMAAGEEQVMEEVVVSATKTQETRGEVPNAVILLDSMDIGESPAAGLGELLGGELGVDWRTRGNYGGAAEEVHIRGMAGDETQVLVNGVSYNSPSFGSADVATVPLNSIDRIEVVKGSGSLLYGSGAMAGTVNVITKRPQRDRMTFAAEAGLGTQGTYRASAEQGMFVTKDFGYYLTANRLETDGFRDNSDLTHNDASLNLVYDRGEAFSVSLYGDTIDREFGLPGVKPPAGTADHFVNGIKYYNADAASLMNEGTTRDSHAVLEIKGAPTEWLSLRAQTDYTYMKSYNLERYNATGWTTVAGEGRESWVNNRVYGAEGNVELKPMESASLLLGVDYQNHDWDTRQIDLDTAGVPKSGATVNNARLFTEGLFAELQYRPAAFARLLAGVRQEAHSTFGYENLPHFGLTLTPCAGTTLKVSHGKHFKAPTPNDLFWPETDFVRGNPNLDAQTGWHSDVTLEQRLLDNTLFATVGYFEWDVDGKITWAQNPAFPGPFGDKWTPTNLNKSDANGWELGLRYDPFYSLGFGLDYTYTDATDQTQTVTRDAQYVPTHQLKGRIVWRHDSGFTATAVAHYVDDRPFYRSSTDAEPTDMLDSYVTVDLRLEQRLAQTWLLAMDIGNLFDKGYDTYVGSFADGTGTRVYGRYPGAGRSVFASVSYVY